MKKMARLLGIVIILTMLLATGITATMVAAEGDVPVTVNAPAAVGFEIYFTASIDIGEVTELNAAQYDISFNPDVLQLDAISDGLINSTPFPVPTGEIAPQEIAPGHWRVVQSLGLDSVNGTGYMSVLHFYVIGIPVSNYTDINITDGVLSGMEGQILATWTGDTINIRPSPFDVITSPATVVTSSSALLNGSLINPGAMSINVSFVWGDASDNLTQETTPQVMNLSDNFSISLSPLFPSTPYFFRAKATDGTETIYGQIANFTTMNQTMVDVVRDLPDTVAPGTTFDVTITFTAPEDSFTPAIVDVAPGDWQVQVDTAWCTPAASESDITAEGIQAEYIWFNAVSAGTQFTVVYKVTVPGDAAEGTYTFPDGDMGYSISGGAVQHVAITGDYQIEVVNGSIISGNVREADSSILSGATISLYLDTVLQGTSTTDQNGDYAIVAPEIGDYTVVASLAGYRDQTRILTVTELGAEYTLNFQGVNSLVPNAADIWYAFDCVALWKFPPAEHPEYALDIWKVFDVVAAWKFPI